MGVLQHPLYIVLVFPWLVFETVQMSRTLWGCLQASYSFFSTLAAGLLHRHDVLDESCRKKFKYLASWKFKKKKKKRKWNGLKSGLTLIVHTAVLVLLAGHKGINLWLAHLLSCGCTTIHVRDMFPISLTIAC